MTQRTFATQNTSTGVITREQDLIPMICICLFGLALAAFNCNIMVHFIYEFISMWMFSQNTAEVPPLGNEFPKSVKWIRILNRRHLAHGKAVCANMRLPALLLWSSGKLRIWN